MTPQHLLTAKAVLEEQRNVETLMKELFRDLSWLFPDSEIPYADLRKDSSEAKQLVTKDLWRKVENDGWLLDDCSNRLQKIELGVAFLDEHASTDLDFKEKLDKARELVDELMRFRTVTK